MQQNDDDDDEWWKPGISWLTTVCSRQLATTWLAGDILADIIRPSSVRELSSACLCSVERQLFWSTRQKRHPQKFSLSINSVKRKSACSRIIASHSSDWLTDWLTDWLVYSHVTNVHVTFNSITLFLCDFQVPNAPNWPHLGAYSALPDPVTGGALPPLQEPVSALGPFTASHW